MDDDDDVIYCVNFKVLSKWFEYDSFLIFLNLS